MGSKDMGAKALEQQLVDRIQLLEQQGLVDEHFRICYSLKQESGLLFFLDLISVFLSDARIVLYDLEKALDQPVVNVDQMYEYCMKLKGSAACIGACRVRNACSNLCNAIRGGSKDECLLSFNVIKEEHRELQHELDSIVELEREILSMKTVKP